MEKIKIGWQPISYDVGHTLNTMHQWQKTLKFLFDRCESFHLLSDRVVS